ncbi:MAG: hypothetical protein OHK0052_23050 [Anaerolineales bacterium]
MNFADVMGIISGMTKKLWILPLLILILLLAAERDTGVHAAPVEQAATAAPLTPQASEPAAVPVSLATPAADGSIVHIVQQGQTLWAVAAIYQIPLDDLLILNGLNQNSFVFPGDKLIIRPPYTPTPTLSPTPAPPTPTRTPTVTPTPPPTYTPAPTFTPTNTPTFIETVSPQRKIAAGWVALLALVLLLLVGIFYKPRP